MFMTVGDSINVYDSGVLTIVYRISALYKYVYNSEGFYKSVYNSVGLIK